MQKQSTYGYTICIDMCMQKVYEVQFIVHIYSDMTKKDTRTKRTGVKHRNLCEEKFVRKSDLKPSSDENAVS